MFVHVNIWRISRTQSWIIHVLRMSLTCLIHTCFASKLVTNLNPDGLIFSQHFFFLPWRASQAAGAFSADAVFLLVVNVTVFPWRFRKLSTSHSRPTAEPHAAYYFLSGFYCTCSNGDLVKNKDSETVNNLKQVFYQHHFCMLNKDWTQLIFCLKIT